MMGASEVFMLRVMSCALHVLANFSNMSVLSDHQSNAYKLNSLLFCVNVKIHWNTLDFS